MLARHSDMTACVFVPFEQNPPLAQLSLPFTEVLFDLVEAVICPARIESRRDVENWRVAAVQRLTE